MVDVRGECKVSLPLGDSLTTLFKEVEIGLKLIVRLQMFERNHIYITK